MKIVFLDIDGVLNNYTFAAEQDPYTGDAVGFGGFFEDNEEPTYTNVKWDHFNVNALDKILKSTNAKVVISSTWRRSFSAKTFNKMFALYYLPQVVIGCTPGNDNKARGLEVAEWLETAIDCDVEAYVILDDLAEFLPDQPLVRTEPVHGLTLEDADVAIKILNGGTE